MARLVFPIIIFALASCAGSDGAPYPRPTASGALLGIFEGKIPCDDCERTKVALALYVDPSTREPGNYTLRQIGVGKSDIPVDTRGTWTISTGTRADADAVVYTLHPDELSFWRADDNVLLILDADRNLRVGNASHSFTLSRTE